METITQKTAELSARIAAYAKENNLNSTAHAYALIGNLSKLPTRSEAAKTKLQNDIIHVLAVCDILIDLHADLSPAEEDTLLCAALLHIYPEYFPADMMTDQPERVLVSEIIREKLLRTLFDEIPHGTAVVIEDFEEDENILRIRAEIYCEKESHKGIIVGKKGETLKKIATYAREDMEAFFGMKVYLNLWVKVKEKWRDDALSLNNFGFKPEDFQ